MSTSLLTSFSRGCLIVGIEGFSLNGATAALLEDPSVGGVILFGRNYESKKQLKTLTHTIHSRQSPPLLITVDQEGGRVQRFVQAFTALPSLTQIGQAYPETPGTALKHAYHVGHTMASELLEVGVDLSFAPVLDLLGSSPAVADRAFHRSPEIVADLAIAYREGMASAGMASVGKHFPGHGMVTTDSHLTLPVDARSWEEIVQSDLVPFKRLIECGLPAVMSAHIIYSQVDPLPATFSSHWLKKVLREELGFGGTIFSDDLGMAGATYAGDLGQRVVMALSAGCDKAIIANESVDMVQAAIKNLNQDFVSSPGKPQD